MSSDEFELDRDELRKLAEAVPGSRVCPGGGSQCTCDKYPSAMAKFKLAANPVAVKALLNVLEAAEAESERLGAELEKWKMEHAHERRRRESAQDKFRLHIDGKKHKALEQERKSAQELAGAQVDSWVRMFEKERKRAEAWREAALAYEDFSVASHPDDLGDRLESAESWLEAARKLDRDGV